MTDVNGTVKEEVQNTDESAKEAEVNGDSVKVEETPKAEETAVKSEDTKDVKPEIKMDPEIRAKKIKRQIEYYFGDFNLPSDKFLREEVKKKDGWIPLETMVKFKRLAVLTTDPEVIENSLKDSEIIQISEDKTEIRRNPEKPLPEENEARRKEVLARSVYVKGFPSEDFTIDNALDYFEEFGPTDDVVLRFWQDKATKTFKFKGSVFVKFPTRDAAAAFLAREEVKYGKEELIRMWQEDYIEKKRNERLEQKMLKRKRPESQMKEEKEDEKGLPKGATLHMTNIPDGLAREVVKERLEQMGASVAFIDYNKGDAEGWIRLYEAGSAANVMKDCENGVLKLKDDQEVTLKPLEGEEEDKFLEAARKSISDRRSKGHRQQKGRRGGRGGRGGRGWGRGRRHDSGEPRAKMVKTEDDDDD